MLDELKKQYKQSLRDKIATVRSLLKDMRAGDDEAENKLRVIAHSLHGSGTTYGYPDISAAAKAAEHADPGDFLKHLTVLITVLQDAAGRKLANPELQEPPATDSGDILIIEDDADISSLLELVLGKKFTDHAIDTIDNAQDAIQALQQKRYALIILDLVLPDYDGRELLKLIKGGLNIDTPVFILSAMDNDRIQADCRALGASHFFYKPFDPDRIADEMQAVFSGASEAVAATGDQTGASGKKKKGARRLLLAEDDELLARIIIHRLGREGITIDHVENGEDALRALDGGHYDLVILDVKMPVIDGFEVLATFRRQAPANEVPVIMLTAMGSEKDIVRGYELGATDYILKPFSPVELIARVKSLM